ERVFKTPGAVLRTAFTSIPRLNRTDFETLRTSLAHPVPPHFRSPTHCPRSSPLKLRASPDSAWKRSPDVFEPPFRTARLEALQPISPLLPRGLVAAEARANE
ncbi:hypothetical protein EDB85DRAFT_1865253, partial [Lactarius pseudohatsudake]